ncbi:hypothetical protein [Thalassoroseus pseudoceratinae]|nr:hypothetical protein [Thalassoroseus pseudoceratinae]
MTVKFPKTQRKKARLEPKFQPGERESDTSGRLEKPERVWSLHVFSST